MNRHKLLILITLLLFGMGIWAVADVKVLNLGKANFQDGQVLSANTLNTLLNDNFASLETAVQGLETGKQNRVGNPCPGGQFVRGVGVDGKLECAVDQVGSGGSVGVVSLNGKSGSLAIEAGDNVTVDNSKDGKITVSAAGGGGGLSTVAHDASLNGNGTAASPLGLADGGVTAAKLATSAPPGAASEVLSWSGTELAWRLPPSGTITGVTAGSGLTGGGASGEVSLALANPLELKGSSTVAVISADNSGGGPGVFGRNDAGDGVYGFTWSGNGVQGRSDSGVGVLGSTKSGYGVYGASESDLGYAGYFAGDVYVKRNHTVNGEQQVIGDLGVVRDGHFGLDVYARGVKLTSDEAAKENFAVVDTAALLDGLAAVPMSTWNYKDDPLEARHLGPTAQAFKAAFGLGDDDTHISAVDAQGVALAAVQALYALVQEKDARIADLEARLATLEGTVSGDETW